ncbi:MAG: hypothetical protein LBM96_04425 [Methanobrevibacter sp.]|jgi:hypothetical protein|nr:hypothetical protein [Candidatus Methanoflexus mossambicus]
MYSKGPSILLGFHGCSKTTQQTIINQNNILKASKNDYDWLGHGVYFWENDLERAEQWAKEHCERKKHEDQKLGNLKHEDDYTPAVIGAYIEAGNCLDLLKTELRSQLKEAYFELVYSYELENKPLPENSGLRNGITMYRKLDCAVIETQHILMKRSSRVSYDTVRGVFFEGEDIYKGSGIKEKNHIQICVRNTNNIKCFFIPRKSEENGFAHLNN